MTAIYGLFATPEQAQQAFDELRSSGIAEREITIQSSEPLEEYEFGSRDRETAMPWIAVAGATTGTFRSLRAIAAVTNEPGRYLLSAFWTSATTRAVRVSLSTSGLTKTILPVVVSERPLAEILTD